MIIECSICQDSKPQSKTPSATMRSILATISYEKLIIVPRGVGLTEFLSLHGEDTITLSLKDQTNPQDLFNDIASGCSLPTSAKYLLLIT